MDRRSTIDEWISTVARAVGLLGLVVFSVKWMVTARIEPSLVAAAGGLYGLGKIGEALAALRQPPPPPPVVPGVSTPPPRGERDQ